MKNVFLVLSVVFNAVVSKYTNELIQHFYVNLEGLSQSDPNTTEKLCTGSLVAKNWVLTAGYCASNPRITKARHFDLLVQRSPSSSPTSRVLKRFPHELYKRFLRKGKRSYSVHDIGLLLIEEIVLQSYAKISSVFFGTVIGLPVSCVSPGISTIEKAHPENAIYKEGSYVVPCGAPRSWGYSLCVYPPCAKNRVNSSIASNVGGPLLYEGMIMGVATERTIMPGLASERYIPAGLYGGWCNTISMSESNSTLLL